MGRESGCIQFVYNLYTIGCFPVAVGPSCIQVVYKLYTTGLPVVYNCIQSVYNWTASGIHIVYNLAPARGGARAFPGAISRFSFLHTNCIRAKKDGCYTNCIQIVYNRGVFLSQCTQFVYTLSTPSGAGVPVVYKLYTTCIGLHNNNCAS